ncbi:hypothetical protein SAMN05660841_01681 [Sphingobacterium nematocida]|uniref:Uncharacterized protein n=1 Tax=Sphingobacterium nematocida TaxID=1513896 RepID=A0A1T5D026_9SPHI|nr:hypothetical protein SAMN05660841_01681 [Sphingobacterium nematocida]
MNKQSKIASKRRQPCRNKNLVSGRRSDEQNLSFQKPKTDPPVVGQCYTVILPNYTEWKLAGSKNKLEEKYHSIS